MPSLTARQVEEIILDYQADQLGAVTVWQQKLKVARSTIRSAVFGTTEISRETYRRLQLPIPLLPSLENQPHVQPVVSGIPQQVPDRIIDGIHEMLRHGIIPDIVKGKLCTIVDTVAGDLEQKRRQRKDALRRRVAELYKGQKTHGL
jgi:hypothetical protein